MYKGIEQCTIGRKVELGFQKWAWVTVITEGNGIGLPSSNGYGIKLSLLNFWVNRLGSVALVRQPVSMENSEIKFAVLF